MHRLLRIAIVSMPAWLATAVRADEFDVENFHAASPGDGRLLGVQSTQQAASGELAVGMTLGMVDDPLVVVAGQDRVAAVVGQRYAAELAAAYGLGRFELRAALPLIVAQSGDIHMDSGITGADGGGTGDARLGVRARLLRAGPVSLAGDLSGTLPTSMRAEYGGQSTPTATPALIAAWQNGPVLIAANAGGRLREARTLGDLEVGSAFLYGVGVSVEARPDVSLVAELGGEIAGAQSNQTPLEVRGGARWSHPSGFSAAAGYGRGLVDGYGAPDHRALVSLAWRSRAEAQPRVVHRLAEAPATPPFVPPADPDPDRDGRLGPDDACPAEAEDFDGFEDGDGCPEADNDHDGLADRDDRCPLHAEDVDAYQDGDGCPDPDNDFDGIADREDRCPAEPEVINSVDDDDGCPDEGKRLVVIGETRIEIREMIYFANDRAEILPRSRHVVEQLAKTLARNPWIKRVRIEGHTDDRADAAYNKDLSQRRARSVADALIALGVDAARFETAGLGEEQPIDSNRTVGGRANNRRVEFHIVAQDQPPPGWRERWSGGAK